MKKLKIEAPNKWQIYRAIAVVMAAITIAALIYCIFTEIERLIADSAAAIIKQSGGVGGKAGSSGSGIGGAIKSFYCIQVAGMCLIVLFNAILIGGGVLFCQREMFLRIWLYLHNIALIGQLHLFILYLVVHRMYAECLLTLCCMAWTGVFIFVVIKCQEQMKKRPIDVLPLLTE